MAAGRRWCDLVGEWWPPACPRACVRAVSTVGRGAVGLIERGFLAAWCGLRRCRRGALILAVRFAVVVWDEEVLEVLVVRWVAGLGRGLMVMLSACVDVASTHHAPYRHWVQVVRAARMCDSISILLKPVDLGRNVCVFSVVEKPLSNGFRKPCELEG